MTDQEIIAAGRIEQLRAEVERVKGIVRGYELGRQLLDAHLSRCREQYDLPDTSVQSLEEAFLLKRAEVERLKGEMERAELRANTLHADTRVKFDAEREAHAKTQRDLCSARSKHMADEARLTNQATTILDQKQALKDEEVAHAKTKKELGLAQDKALRFDLDQAGIEQRDAEDVELVELRAEVERLKAALVILAAEVRRLHATQKGGPCETCQCKRWVSHGSHEGWWYCDHIRNVTEAVGGGCYAWEKRA
jgi:hypothetical protein